MAILNPILLVLFIGVTFLAFLTSVSLLLPAPVERARKILETGPVRSFLVGLINLIFWLMVIALYFIWNEYGSGPAVMPYLIVSALLILLFIGVIVPGLPGLVALAQLLGMRMAESRPPLQQNLLGGLILLLACLTPYVGWFIFTPAVVSIAIGAGLRLLIQRKPGHAPESKEQELTGKG